MIFFWFPWRTTPRPEKLGPDPVIEGAYQRHVRWIYRITGYAIGIWAVALAGVLLLGAMQ